MNPEIVLAAILAIFPRMSHHNRQCIVRDHDRIVHQLQDIPNAVSEGMTPPPTEIVAAIGFIETHLGCDVGEGGNWGAPRSRSERHRAGTHRHAIRALSRSYNVCGTWEGAINRFHTGLCNPRVSSSRSVRDRGRSYQVSVRTVVNRIREFAATNESSLPTNDEVVTLGTNNLKI